MNLQVPVEHSKEVNDYKNLIKTLVMGTESWQNNLLTLIMILYLKIYMFFFLDLFRNENNNMEYNPCSFSSTSGLCSVVFTISVVLFCHAHLLILKVSPAS